MTLSCLEKSGSSEVVKGKQSRDWEEHESMNQPIPRHLLGICYIPGAQLSVAMEKKVEAESFRSIHSGCTWGGHRVNKGTDVSVASCACAGLRPHPMQGEHKQTGAQADDTQLHLGQLGSQELRARHCDYLPDLQEPQTKCSTNISWDQRTSL